MIKIMKHVFEEIKESLYTAGESLRVEPITSSLAILLQ